MNLTELGEFAEAVAEAQRAAQQAEALGHSYSLQVACWLLGTTYLRRGELNGAIPYLERSLELCYLWNLAMGTPVIAAALCLSYVRAGRASEAEPLLETTRHQAVAPGFVSYRPLIFNDLGEALLLTGRAEAAADLAQSALDSARAVGQHGYEAWALRLLGDIGSRQTPPDLIQSEDYYRQALALAEELGMRPLQAHCHFGLGKLYRRTGKQVEGQEHLTTTTMMYRSMAMTFWLSDSDYA